MEFLKKYEQYYDDYSGNFSLPENLCRLAIDDVLQFLKEHQYSYSLCYLSEEAGYDDNYFCLVYNQK